MPVSAGQAPDLRFHHIGVEDGLPNMTVDALHQDRFGFIWIGTWDGVCRYDGKSFEVFRTIPGDTTSLIFNEIKGFSEPNDSSLWVSTYGGLTRWDHLRGRFFNRTIEGRRFPSHPKLVHHIVSDLNGDLLMGSNNGDNLYVMQGDTATYPLTFEASTTNSHPPCMLAHNAGIWVGDDRGLFIIRRGNQQREPASSYDPSLSGFQHLQVRCLLEDRNGVIWIGTESSLWGYSPLTGALEEVKQADGSSIHHITALEEGLDGQLWIGTRRGLFCRHQLSREITAYKHAPADHRSISQDHIKSLLVDRSGSLWVGTARGGLNLANLRKPSPFHAVGHSFFDLPLHELVVFSFEEAETEDEIWVGTNHGLHLMNGDDGSIIRSWHEGEVDGLAGETVMSMIRLESGELLVSTRPGGIQILDPVSGEIRHVSNPHMGEQEAISFFRSMRKTGPDTLLLAGNLGVWLFFPRTESWKQLSNGYCWDAVPADHPCQILIAENGLHLIDMCADTQLMYRWHPTPHDHKRPVTVLHRDTASLWVGTYGMGLLRVDLTDWSFRRWSRKDGLPSDYVFAIEEDGQDRLWLSTTEGLARLDKSGGNILTFSVDDGLVDNEFGTGSAMVTEEGEMFFGGNNGFISFFPDQVEIRQSRYEPPLLINSLSLSGKSMQLDSAVWMKQRISFPGYQQQHLEIGFAALDYSRSDNLTYQFRLRGWDDRWSLPNRRANAQFTNLSPGTYEFQVRSTNGDGMWTSPTRSLTIVISPLWYQIWWVRVLAPIGSLFLLVGGIVIRLRQLRKRERVELLHRIASIRQEALSAQMDHHFTFNALNSIQRFITENNKKASLYYISRFGKLIRRFLDQARKHEHPIEDEISTLDLYLSLEALRCRDAFSYQFEVDPEIDPFNTDIPTSLLQPIVENAIWHGLVPRKDEHGLLMVRFHLQESHLVLTVEDNGVGWGRATRKPDGHQSKGMTMIRERLQALETLTGQSLSVTVEANDPGTDFPGTRVSISLPPPDTT